MPASTVPIFLLVPNHTGFEESARTHGKVGLPFPSGEHLSFCLYSLLACMKNLGLPGRRGMGCRRELLTSQ